MSAEPKQFNPCEYGGCGHKICEAVRRLRGQSEGITLNAAFVQLFDAVQHHCHNCQSKQRGALMESMEPLAKLRAEIRARESGGN